MWSIGKTSKFYAVLGLAPTIAQTSRAFNFLAKIYGCQVTVKGGERAGFSHVFDAYSSKHSNLVECFKHAATVADETTI